MVYSSDPRANNLTRWNWNSVFSWIQKFLKYRPTFISSQTPVLSLSWQIFIPWVSEYMYSSIEINYFFLTCGCFVIVRSSNQSNKPVKLPVTPSTATLTKTQKNKTKNKKKPVEQKTTKQSVSPAKNTSIPAPSSSQVTGFACSLKYIIIWWNYILV